MEEGGGAHLELPEGLQQSLAEAFEGPPSSPPSRPICQQNDLKTSENCNEQSPDTSRASQKSSQDGGYSYFVNAEEVDSRVTSQSGRSPKGRPASSPTMPRPEKGAFDAVIPSAAQSSALAAIMSAMNPEIASAVQQTTQLEKQSENVKTMLSVATTKSSIMPKSKPLSSTALANQALSVFGADSASKSLMSTVHLPTPSMMYRRPIAAPGEPPQHLQTVLPLTATRGVVAGAGAGAAAGVLGSVASSGTSHSEQHQHLLPQTTQPELPQGCRKKRMVTEPGKEQQQQQISIALNKTTTTTVGSFTTASKAMTNSVGTLRPPKSPLSPVSPSSAPKSHDGLPAVGMGMFSQIAGAPDGLQIASPTTTSGLASPGRNTRRRFLARPGAESQEQESVDSPSIVTSLPVAKPNAEAEAKPMAPPATAPVVAGIIPPTVPGAVPMSVPGTTGTGRKRGRPPKKKRGIAARKAAEAAAEAAALAIAEDASLTIMDTEGASEAGLTTAIGPQEDVSVIAGALAPQPTTNSKAEQQHQHHHQPEVAAVRIVFSGIEPESQLVEAIPGAVEVDKPTLATHLVLGSKERRKKKKTKPMSSPGSETALVRTPKLLVAINTGVQYVVCLEWLVDSAAAKQALPIEVSTSEGEGVGYLVSDEDKQSQYGFDMRNTLATAKQRQQAGGKSSIFANLAVYCTEEVCGVCAPKEADMAGIIESGGGVWLGAGGDLETQDGAPMPLRWLERLQVLQVSPESVQIVILSTEAALQTHSTSQSAATSPDRAGRGKRSAPDSETEVTLPPSLDAFLKRTSPATHCSQVLVSSLHGRVMSPEFIYRSVLRQTLVNPDSENDDGVSCLNGDGERAEPIVVLDTRAIATTTSVGARPTAVSRFNKRVRTQRP